jgi:hypothetical protein
VRDRPCLRSHPVRVRVGLALARSPNPTRPRRRARRLPRACSRSVSCSGRCAGASSSPARPSCRARVGASRTPS